MKKKSLWGNLKGKIFSGVEDVRKIRDNSNKIRQQFVELSRLGNNPIVMQMGN